MRNRILSIATARAIASTDSGVASGAGARVADLQPPKPTPSGPGGPPASAARQRLDIGIGETGYEPSTLTVRVKIPVTLVVEEGEGCAAGFLMPALGVSADNSRGPVSVDMGVLGAGIYAFTCGMGMLEGRLVVRS